MTLDGKTLETAEIVIPWMIWEDKTVLFEKDRTLEDDERIHDEDEIILAENDMKTLIGNIHAAEDTLRRCRRFWVVGFSMIMRGGMTRMRGFLLLVIPFLCLSIISMILVILR